MRWPVLSLPLSFSPAHTHCPALVPCSAAGCAILHAPPPCLSTGGRIGCDRRSQFPLPTVCLLVRDPPPPFQASTPACVSAHSRIDHAATQVHVPSSPNSSVLTPSASACRFYVGLPSTLLIPRPRAVALAGAFDAVVAAVKSPGLPPEPQCDSSCCIVDSMVLLSS